MLGIDLGDVDEVGCGVKVPSLARVVQRRAVLVVGGRRVGVLGKEKFHCSNIFGGCCEHQGRGVRACRKRGVDKRRRSREQVQDVADAPFLAGFVKGGLSARAWHGGGQARASDGGVKIA